MENTKLTSTVTVKQYRKFRDEENRDAIADLIFERFFERYLEPFKNNQSKHGFSMMAVGCLMTESLYCFKKGLKKVGGSGGTAFNNFFSESSKLRAFDGHGEEFYKKVRCGILHQGETYDGWKILRSGALFQKSEKVVNATKYLDAMEVELRTFTEHLKTGSFKSKSWKGVIQKLDYICENCKTNA